MDKILEDIGLTKGEIAVYKALLDLGETTTGPIIDTAKISSGKIYHILERLIDKGLAGFIIKGKTKHFLPTSPNVLKDLLENQKEEIDKKKTELDKIIPQLMLMRSKTSYEAVFFKGYKGIKNAIHEVLAEQKDGDKILALGIDTRREEKYNIMWKHWHDERIRKGVRCDMLFSVKDEIYVPMLRKKRFTEVRLFEGDTPATINISKDRVLIFTYHDEPGILSIKHKDIVRSFDSFFRLLWKCADTKL